MNGRVKRSPVTNSGRDSNDPQGTSRSSDNLEWRRDDDGAGRRKLVEIAQTGQPKLAATVHEVMIREGRIESGSLAGVSADRFHADT